MRLFHSCEEVNDFKLNATQSLVSHEVIAASEEPFRVFLKALMNDQAMFRKEIACEIGGSL